MPKGVYIRTEENRKNISLSKKGRHLSEEHKQKIKIGNARTQFKKGHKHSPEALRKMSLSRIGKPSGKKGKKVSEEGRERIRLGQLKRFSNKENHPRWKGSQVGYRALHEWVEKRLGKPNRCEHCKNDNLSHRQYHWANVSHEYKREEADWIRLCVKCHKLFDKK